MVAVVVICNCAIAFLNFYLAWQIWQLGARLRQFTDTLVRVEQIIHRVFNQAPGYVKRGEGGTRRLRRYLYKLARQWEQMARLLQLLGTIISLSQRSRLLIYSISRSGEV